MTDNREDLDRRAASVYWDSPGGDHIDGIRAVVDLVLAERPERNDERIEAWERVVLRWLLAEKTAERDELVDDLASLEAALAERRQANVGSVPDVLRKAADIYNAHTIPEWSFEAPDNTVVNLRQLADELEAEHRREAEREKLIELAAEMGLNAASDAISEAAWESAADWWKDGWRIAARAMLEVFEAETLMCSDCRTDAEAAGQ